LIKIVQILNKFYKKKTFYNIYKVSEIDNEITKYFKLSVIYLHKYLWNVQIDTKNRILRIKQNGN